DWSSDVCSSDLDRGIADGGPGSCAGEVSRYRSLTVAAHLRPPYGITTRSALGKANLRPASSTTLIWQRYRPGTMSLSGIWMFTGTASGRVPAVWRASIGPTSNALAPF